MNTPNAETLLAGIRTAARMILERQDAATQQAATIRAAAKDAGYSIDTRIDYAEGSAAAYAVAGAILSGALGYPNIREMAGDITHNEPLPPMLPDIDAVQFAPGDRIASAVVIRERMASHETGE